MALLYPKLKKVFIHVPRTGGTSFEWAIRKSVSGSVCRKYGLQNHKKHFTFEDIGQIYKPFADDWRSWDIVTFTRNPWDMVLSWFLFYNSSSNPESYEREDFITFIKLSFLKGDVKSLFPHTGSNIQDNSLLSYYGDAVRNLKSYKFESYKGSFKAASRLFSDTPLHPDDFTHTHRTPKIDSDKQHADGHKILTPEYWSNGGDYVLGESTYREFYTKTERDLVYQYTSDYCARFDYKF